MRLLASIKSSGTLTYTFACTVDELVECKRLCKLVADGTMLQFFYFCNFSIFAHDQPQLPAFTAAWTV